ncbi:MAG: radical SAM protein [Candidatus Hydrogenedentes bacterium]|nr:radical SAM protein [Candidatus Hydrogenedentota bacterium]
MDTKTNPVLRLAGDEAAAPVAQARQLGPFERLWQRLIRSYVYHVIVHITDRCNLRCKTCFVEFGRNDLTVEQAALLARKLGHIPSLDIGGGEPFLHPRIIEICKQFRFGTVTIPTNGQFADRVVNKARELVAAFPRAVTLAVSIDGFEETNDAVRGPGSFKKALETYRRLREIPDLTVKVNTVVTNRNIDELAAFVRYVRGLAPDYHSLLLLRGDPLAPEEVHLPDATALRLCTPELFRTLRTYTYGNRWNVFARYLKANYQEYMWRVSLRLIEEKRAVFQCKAPHYSKVIYADGTASMCELKPRLANLIGEDADVAEARFRANLDAFEAEHGYCYCTHNCNMAENIMTHPLSVVKIILGILH